MPVEAERVHGLSAAFLSTKPRFAELADELLEFLGDAPLVAHNAGFDFGFLNSELELAGRRPISMDRMVDTVALARRKHGRKLSLDACAPATGSTGATGSSTARCSMPNCSRRSMSSSPAAARSGSA